jgi:membrane-associated phospholipid phosphatase
VANASARQAGTGPEALTAWWAILAPTDRLLLAYLVGLAAVAAATHPHPLPILAAIAALAVAIGGIARVGARWPAARWVHDFLPIASIICVFDLSGPVIASANATRWDGTLAALDHALFGALPHLWFGLLGRPAWLTDAATLLYACYYVVPVAMGVALYRAGRRADFDHFVFTVIATFLISYGLYFLTPTLGPRVADARANEVLGGGALSEVFRAFLRSAEVNELDAFPSGHAAISLVLLGLCWRMLPRWRLPVALLVAGILFSTVYLSLHYVIDLVAGALLAALVPFLAPLLHGWVAPRRELRDQRPSSRARQRPPDQPIRSNRPLR